MTLGGEVARVAEQLGKPLMPWQRMVAEVGLELDENGLPAYREVIATVMRQNGKSTLTGSVMAHRSAIWRTQPQRVLYSAQDGSSARKKLIEDLAPMWLGPPRNAVSPLVQRVYKGVGYEGVTWRTGSRIDVLASSESAGHGRTLDLAVIDESFADVDDRREQAIRPAMATKRDAQVWNVSTAGTAASVFLRRKIDLGRAAAESGSTSGICYFEWSIPDDADVDDPETWWSYMPALGWTITEHVVADARASMTDGDWRRSFGNQWTAANDRVIPEHVWRAVQDRDAVPGDRPVLCVDVSPDRDQATIAASSGDGAVAVLVRRGGTSWVPGYVAELVAQRPVAEVVLDGRGPAAAIAPDLEAQGLRVRPLSTPEVLSACQSFYDAVADRTVCIRPDGALDEAVAHVVRLSSGDTWRWGRKGTTDITPLMAVSLAHWAATRGAVATPFFVY